MKLSEQMRNKLDSLVAKAERMYDKKALNRDISDLAEKGTNLIVAEAMKNDKDLSYFDARSAAFRHASIQKIQQFAIKRMREQGNMTVGELIDHLSKFDKDRVVKIMCHVSCVTDAGSDLGGMEDHKITDIVDLETRIEVNIERD